MTLWQWILAVLAALSADPHAVDRETPKAAAAVAVAYAATAPEPAPEPPKPPAPKPGTGKPCPDGRCPTGAALTPGSPARPAGGR